MDNEAAVARIYRSKRYARSPHHSRHLLGLLLLATPSTLGAESPRFAGNLTRASLSGQNLAVSFEEAGLLNSAVETITAAANWFCGYGSANPQAPNRRTSGSQLSSQPAATPPASPA